MPNYPDKIIINSKGNSGMNALIVSDLETLKELGDEIVADLDLLKDTTDLRDEMATLCADHYKAQMNYHNGLKKLIDKTAARIDAKIASP